MRHDDDLSPIACFTKMRYEFVEYGIGIEVLLRLINDERALIIEINSEVKEQQDDASCAGRQSLNRNAIVLDTISQLDMPRTV